MSKTHFYGLFRFIKKNKLSRHTHTPTAQNPRGGSRTLRRGPWWEGEGARPALTGHPAEGERVAGTSLRVSL